MDQISIWMHLIIDKIREIIKLLDGNNLKTNADNELKNSIITIEKELSTNNPRQNIIREALKTIKNLLECIAGNIIASGILDLFNNSVSCLTSLAKCTAFCSF
jgi:hypothetical protein